MNETCHNFSCLPYRKMHYNSQTPSNNVPIASSCAHWVDRGLQNSDFVYLNLSTEMKQNFDPYYVYCNIEKKSGAVVTQIRLFCISIYILTKKQFNM